jgi:hypothetical protein
MGGPIGQLEAPVQWTGDIGELEGPDPADLFVSELSYKRYSPLHWFAWISQLFKGKQVFDRKPLAPASPNCTSMIFSFQLHYWFDLRALLEWRQYWSPWCNLLLSQIQNFLQQEPYKGAETDPRVNPSKKL